MSRHRKPPLEEELSTLIRAAEHVSDAHVSDAGPEDAPDSSAASRPLVDATPCNISKGCAPQQSDTQLQPVAGGEVGPLHAEIAPVETVKKLSAKQKLAAGLIANGAGICEAAKAVGVSRETMWRWSNHPAFRNEVHATIEDKLSDTTLAARNLLRHAMVVIEHALTHGHTAKSHVAVAVLRSKRLWHTAGAMAFKSDG
jgi:hypothetical protein